MKVYIAGPMSGIPQFNIPKFFRVASILKENGFYPVNPAELDGDSGLLVASLKNLTGDPTKTEGFSNGFDETVWAQVLGRDVELVLSKVEGIVLLEGWQKSKGARIEAFCALTQGLHFYLWQDDDLHKEEADYVRQELLANG